MKRISLFAVLCIFSVSAWADRTFEADSNGAWQSRGEACQAAKGNARKKVRSDEHLIEIGDCDCERADEAGNWSCSVEASAGSGAEISVNRRNF